MEQVKNNQIVLKHYINGSPKETDFCHKTQTITLKLPQGSNGVLLKNLYLSCDPYMRNRMAKTSYADSFTPGQVSTYFLLIRKCSNKKSWFTIYLVHEKALFVCDILCRAPEFQVILTLTVNIFLSINILNCLFIFQLWKFWWHYLLLTAYCWVWCG